MVCKDNNFILLLFFQFSIDGNHGFLLYPRPFCKINPGKKLEIFASALRFCIKTLEISLIFSGKWRIAQQFCNKAWNYLNFFLEMIDICIRDSLWFCIKTWKFLEFFLENDEYLHLRFCNKHWNYFNFFLEMMDICIQR